jgi:hypothetical protein
MTEEALYFYVSDGNTDTLTVTPSEGIYYLHKRQWA